MFRRKIMYVVIFLATFCFFISVYAEDTYTCSAENVSGFYCSLLTDNLKQTYGCTITNSGNGCSGVCTNLTEADIQKYGSYLNMDINDCTKNGSSTNGSSNESQNSTQNGTQDSTQEPSQESTPNEKVEEQTDTKPGVTTTGSSDAQNVDVNPKTGMLPIIIIFMIAIVSLVSCFFYYRKLATNSLDIDNIK